MFKAAIASMVLAAQSQDARGDIGGRVFEPTGALVAGVEVRAVSDNTGMAVPTKKNEAGSYVPPFLVPGMYSVSAEVRGFRKFERKNVQVRVSENVALDIQMMAGEVTETAFVTSEPPLLQTVDSPQGQVDRPTPDCGTSAVRRQRDGPCPSCARNGKRTCGCGRLRLTMRHRSFRRTAGALVNVSTKGGGDEFLRQAWWWLRHSAFDTPTIYQNRTGIAIPVYGGNRHGLAGGRAADRDSEGL